MKLINHPNILRLLSAFVDGSKLLMVEPYVAHGSVLKIIENRYKYGLEEKQHHADNQPNSGNQVISLTLGRRNRHLDECS